jgi:ribose transport system substrate-binding protein
MGKRTIALLLTLLIAVTLFAACTSDTEVATSGGNAVASKTPAAGESAAASVSAPASESAAASADTADTAAAATKDLDIIWIHSGASNQSEQRAFAGFSAFIKEQGWNWKVTEVNSEDSDAKAANNISDAVAKGCDVIVCSMVDMRASAPAIQEANAAKIPVYTIDSGYTDGVVVDVTSNNNVMSAKVSTYLVDAIGGSGNICVLSASGFAGGRKRGNVLNAVLSESPGIKVLDNHNIDLTDFFNDSANTAEDWLSRFNDKINAIWCVWDEPAIAVSNVLTAAGKTRKDIVVTGIDGNESAVQMMRDGSPIIATVAQPFELMGSTTAKLIQKGVVQQIAWDKAVGATTIYVDAPLITTSNTPEKGTPAYEAVDFYSAF